MSVRSLIFDMRFNINQNLQSDPTIMEHITDSCGELMMRYIEMPQ